MADARVAKGRVIAQQQKQQQQEFKVQLTQNVPGSTPSRQYATLRLHIEG